jgi:DNA-binding LacI/PurR family transcriptional regulator
LPGERELGRRFEANAKTINKALCDLSSEGLLIRRIGRGTFVAAQNGGTEALDKTNTCVLLAPSDSDARPDRQALFAELRRLMDEKAASLDIVHAERLTEGRIPLAHWPADRRRRTACLAYCPIDPLSTSSGHLSDDCILEGYRRHVPIIVIGALSRSARVSSVAPDYGDAGLRLTEHLFQAGCGRVVVLTCGDSREAQMVVAGAQASGIRQGGEVRHVVLGEGMLPLEQVVEIRKGELVNENEGPLGVILVGTAVQQAAAGDERLRIKIANGSILSGCVTEPGINAAESLCVTSYDVDPRRIAEWAVRLLLESRPGQRPLEILVVGDLRVRASAGPRSNRKTARTRPPAKFRHAARLESGTAPSH